MSNNPLQPTTSLTETNELHLLEMLTFEEEEEEASQGRIIASASQNEDQTRNLSRETCTNEFGVKSVASASKIEGECTGLMEGNGQGNSETNKNINQNIASASQSANEKEMKRIAEINHCREMIIKTMAALASKSDTEKISELRETEKSDEKTPTEPINNMDCPSSSGIGLRCTDTLAWAMVKPESDEYQKRQKRDKNSNDQLRMIIFQRMGECAMAVRLGKEDKWPYFALVHPNVKLNQYPRLGSIISVPKVEKLEYFSSLNSELYSSNPNEESGTIYNIIKSVRNEIKAIDVDFNVYDDESDDNIYQRFFPHQIGPDVKNLDLVDEAWAQITGFKIQNPLEVMLLPKYRNRFSTKIIVRPKNSINKQFYVGTSIFSATRINNRRYRDIVEDAISVWFVGYCVICRRDGHWAGNCPNRNRQERVTNRGRGGHQR